jgi:hypothetical protein
VSGEVDDEDAFTCGTLGRIPDLAEDSLGGGVFVGDASNLLSWNCASARMR